MEGKPVGWEQQRSALAAKPRENRTLPLASASLTQPPYFRKRKRDQVLMVALERSCGIYVK